MKSQETRDSLSILFVNNEESLKTLIGQPALSLENFAETIVDYKNPQENYTKPENVSNNSTLIYIVLNFALIIGVSVYNLWQFRILSGLDKGDSNKKKGSDFSISLKPPYK